MMNEPLLNNIGSAVFSLMEDKHYYDIAKQEYETFFLNDPYVPDEYKQPFGEYSLTQGVITGLKGLMRNWEIHHEETGLYFEPLIDEYIMEDLPVDFGFRITKELK